MDGRSSFIVKIERHSQRSFQISSTIFFFLFGKMKSKCFLFNYFFQYFVIKMHGWQRQKNAMHKILIWMIACYYFKFHFSSHQFVTWNIRITRWLNPVDWSILAEKKQRIKIVIHEFCTWNSNLNLINDEIRWFPASNALTVFLLKE